jgi:hypothetical protein
MNLVFDPMSLRVTGVLSACVFIASARSAVAQPAPVAEPASVPTDSATEEPAQAPSNAPPASAAAAEGAFLPFTSPASSRPTFGTVNSGYDGARKVVLYEALADAHVVGGLSVRAGYSSHDLAGQPSALLGARYQLLSQARYGLDLGVGLFYEPHDIEGEGLVRGSVALSRTLGKLALFGAVGYGQDPEGDDHRADLSIASLYAVVPAFHVGVDARARALVFSSDPKHDGLTEPVLDLAAGPFAQFLVGPVALTGQIGLSAVSFETHGATRPTSEMRVGPIALLGAGLSL